jgi:5-methylcytosine-specific restriction endonuclease McrA
MRFGNRRPVRPQLSTATWRRARTAVKARDGQCCRVCGSDGWIPAHTSRSGRQLPGRFRLVVGHVVPAEQYRGSHDDPRNLRTMCVSCNNSQRDLTDDQWRAARAARRAGPPGQRPTETSRFAYGRPRPRVW